MGLDRSQVGLRLDEAHNDRRRRTNLVLRRVNRQKGDERAGESTLGSIHRPRSVQLGSGLDLALCNSPVCLDTCVFIYYVEEHPTYLQHVAPIFEAIDDGTVQGVTSALTLMESLIIPFRFNNRKLMEQYISLFHGSKNLELRELDTQLLTEAAKLRARSAMKTPDAIQIAAAKLSGCQMFITNDRKIPKMKGMKIVQLSEIPVV